MLDLIQYSITITIRMCLYILIAISIGLHIPLQFPTVFLLHFSSADYLFIPFGVVEYQGVNYHRFFLIDCTHVHKFWIQFIFQLIDVSAVDFCPKMAKMIVIGENIYEKYATLSMLSNLFVKFIYKYCQHFPRSNSPCGSHTYSVYEYLF